MSSTAARNIDLEGLRRRLVTSPDADRLRPIGLQQIITAPDALAELPRLLVGALGGNQARGHIVLLQDATPMLREGADLKQTVERLVATQFDVRAVTVGPSDGRVHADEDTVAAACEASAGGACLVTVGSGTLADIGKVVASTLGGVPHVLIQTAASVNGFADDQSVLLRQGVKRTVPSRWPDVLVLDLPTLVAAPSAMNLAGFGDLMSMFTAPADWYLACASGMDDSWLPTVVDLARAQGDDLLEMAPRLAARDPDAVGRLAEILALSGISMGLAGRTAPSSGMEHTISHLVEMAAGQRGTRTALHGATVGVATVVASLVWRRVRQRLGAGALDELGAPPGEAEMAGQVRAAFDPLDSTGAMAAECWSDYARKLRRWRERGRALGDFARNWTDHDKILSDLLVEPERLVAALADAGAPLRFADLDPPVDADTARWAIANCHLVRDRFTVADLACFAGAWGANDVDTVLTEAAALGAGL